jgi:hypothetical protein
MFKRFFAIIFLFLFLFLIATQSKAFVVIKPWSTKQPIASHVLPLDDRYAVESVNTVFQDNILLTLKYLSGDISSPSKINWKEIKKPFKEEFELKPGEVFAFHNDVLAQYQNKRVLTTNAHFNAQEGFRSDGYLYGDGVCHLASFMRWVAEDAGLSVIAPTNHNFARIPDVPAQYGTSIFTPIGQSDMSKQQNLYIENTTKKPVKFVFNYDGKVLTLSIVQV